MTVQELITRLDKIDDKDQVITYIDCNGGWDNIDVEVTKPYVSIAIVPSSNREK